MNDRALASRWLGGAVVVVLAGAAAYVGASIAHRGPEDSSVTPPSAGAEHEALVRRVGALEQRVTTTEDTARTALELARRHDDAAASTTPVKPESAGPAPSSGAKAESPDVKTPAEEPSSVEKIVATRLKSRARDMVAFRMQLFADATREGDANRRIQSAADARAFMAQFGLKGEDTEATVRKVFEDHWAQGAREIGPLVHDGLDRADIAAVREKLGAIEADTDRRVQALLNDDQRKDYKELVAATRKAADDALGEFERTRLRTDK